MGLKPRRGRAGTLAQYFLELGVDFALGAGAALPFTGSLQLRMQTPSWRHLCAHCLSLMNKMYSESTL